MSRGQGICEWLSALTVGSRDLEGATFDTKISKPRLPGSAAHAAHKRLRHLGIHPLAAAETFYVTDRKGLLAEGEADRARYWGEQLAREAKSKVGGVTG